MASSTTSIPATRPFWNYPDTGKWDPERNTREFVAAMPEWRRHGLLSFTIDLQGGNPRGYMHPQPWYNSAFDSQGSAAQGVHAPSEEISWTRQTIWGWPPSWGISTLGKTTSFRMNPR